MDAPHALRAAAAVSKRPHVVIIGAGFAGLMAAYALRGRCKVTVFEARDRIGGRVWSRATSSGIIEAGGELIGYDHPLWIELATQFDLGFSVLSTDTSFDSLHLEMPLYLDGTKLTEPQMKVVYDEMEVAFDRMSKQATAIHDPYQPWLAKHAVELDKMPLSKWIAGLDCTHLTRVAMEQQFSNDGGAPTTNQSYLGNLAVVAGGAICGARNDFFNNTETLRCSEGNQTLATRLADAIGAGNIHLSTPVSAIHVGDGKVSVEPKTGPAITADYAILAIPPNLWPGNPTAKIAIDPVLPRAYHITMGTAVKYLSPLKRRFWISDGLSPSSTSNQYGVTWEGTDNQIAAPGTDVELSLFSGGAVAHAALAVFKNGGQAAVRAFYEPRIGTVYSGYAANIAREPSFIPWPDDEWTAGGYSCPAPGEVCTAGPLLNEGFHKRLFFAGEHTCPAYYGYMEGALQSGKTAASTILNLI